MKEVKIIGLRVNSYIISSPKDRDWWIEKKAKTPHEAIEKLTPLDWLCLRYRVSNVKCKETGEKWFFSRKENKLIKHNCH